MFRLSRTKLGLFPLCSTYVLTFPNKIGHISIVLDLYFDFPDQNWACARLMFRLSKPKLGMCSTYVSTIQTELGHVLDLCFHFPDQNWTCARFVFRLSRPKLGMCSTYFSTFQTKIGHVLDLCFNFPDQKWACFDCARPMF